MGKVLPEITPELAEFIAHLAQNGRITFMFRAFQGPPRILRLFGRGRVVLPDDAKRDALRPLFPDAPGVRQLVATDVARVQTSRGYAVPLMGAPRQRDALIRWAEAKGPEGLKTYRGEKNAASIGALPTHLALRVADAAEGS